MNERDYPRDALIEARIDNLDLALSEPAFDETVVMAREYRELLADIDITKEEGDRIIYELDMQAGVLVGMQIQIYGNIQQPDEQQELVSRYIETDRAVFNGFTLFDKPIYVGDEIARVERTIGFHLILESNEESDDENDRNPSKRVVANLEDVHIEFPGFSFERAQAWLVAFHPDIIEDIDTAILNTEMSEDEVGAIMALKDIELTPPDADTEGDLFNCLIMYVNKTIEVDTDVPYSICIDGPVYVDTDRDGSYTPVQIHNGIRLATVHSIRIVTELSAKTGKEHYKFCLSMVVIHETRTGDNLDVVAPLSSISSISSIRSAFYEA